jgi:DNA-directed RNA polymerase specialized sigma24 family protein
LQVVLLHWSEGLTTVEVAARTGHTATQVRGLLYRAKPKLRACLASRVEWF